MKAEVINNKMKILLTSVFSIILVIFLMSAITSCGTQNNQTASTSVENSSTTLSKSTTKSDISETSRTTAATQSDTSMKKEIADIEDIKAEFEVLREAGSDPVKNFAFIDANIKFADTEFADEMIDFVLQFSESELYPFGDKYANAEIQQKLWTDFNGTTDLEILKNADDEIISKLARETIDRRYKLEGIEGYISPIIDYESYKSYGMFLSKEMNSFIEIMAFESESSSIMDGAVVIPLDDFAVRIIKLYEFEEEYPGFIRIYYIVNMLNGKLWVYMGGIDNTPVFNFENNAIIQERLDNFKANAEKYKGTRFGDKLAEYIELLKAENYKRTQKVSDYIDNLTFY